MIQTAHTTRSRPVAAHRRSLTGSLARERAVRGWHTKATGDDDRAVPGGLLAGGLKNALGFFKARMDEMMEDEEEALVTRVVQRSRDDDSVASWSIDLSVFLREPTTPLSAKAAARVERVSLGMECEYAERDAGVYPSRGGAGVRGSRYFVDDGLSDPSGADATPGFFWLADEPGYFKFTLRLNEPVVASGRTVLPAGDVTSTPRSTVRSAAAATQLATEEVKSWFGCRRVWRRSRGTSRRRSSARTTAG